MGGATQRKPPASAGELISDDIVMGVIKENINTYECSRGFVLEGFPRTLNQAKVLDEMLLSEDAGVIDKVIEFKVADEIIIGRVGKDKAASIKPKLEAFRKGMQPVVDHYTSKGVYRPLDANQSAKTLAAALAAIAW